MENKFLDLTNTVYKLLDFFPESDPLKNRAKDKALSIMESLTLINENSGWMSFDKERLRAQILEDIDILLGYLWIGKSQKWLSSVNCLIVSNEYDKIKKGIVAVGLVKKLPVVSEIEPEIKIEKKEPLLTDRQKKILDFIQTNGRAQVMDLQTILPDVTKRTIRRDLDDLLQTRRIARFGDFNQVFYKIIDGTN